MKVIHDFNVFVYSTIINIGDVINILKCKVISISIVGDSFFLGGGGGGGVGLGAEILNAVLTKSNEDICNRIRHFLSCVGNEICTNVK